MLHWLTRHATSIIRCWSAANAFSGRCPLPPALARFLEAHGHESKAVRETGLRDAEDTVIRTFAQTGGWVVVTKDEDFAERAIQSVTGPQVLWLRIGNSTNRVLFAWLEPLLPAAVLDLQSGHRLVELQRQPPDGSRA